MRLAGRLALWGLAVAAGSVAALAQSTVISARSGLIHYVEGQVYLGDQTVESKFGTFPEVKENQQLKTEEGRAEVLLTPGVFLRLGENSSFRMITNRLIDTRLEFLSGSAIVEAEQIGKDNSITVVYKDATIHIMKKGLYRVDAGSGELRVFDGLADVTSDDRTVEAKEGHLVALDTLADRKFDKTSTDALNRWSERRAEYVSMANVSAANSLRSSMYGSNSLTYGGSSMYGGGSAFESGWYFNPFFGMYTFVPGMLGNWYSPYGYRYWSPFDVYQAYMPGYYYSPYGSYGGGYGSGYRGTGSYNGAYNSVNYRSVPVPSHSGTGITGTHGATGSAGSSGSVASGHGPSSGTGSVSSGLSSGSVSRGGGSVGGGSVGGGGGGSHH